jgi:anti-sigma regulatory factor (Ser/Thr protein kinase)
VGTLAPGATTGAGPARAAEHRFRFELAAHPGSPAQARRLTRSRLKGWSVCEDTCDTAALVISELVTNAIVHTASSRVVCELYDRGDLVRISVRDEGSAPGEPHPSPQRPEEEHGRGLLLVDALCRAWGVQQQGPGLMVWAELARTAGDSASRTERNAWDGHDAMEGHDARDGHDARGDLGWGARPKPGPSRPGAEDDPQAEHAPPVPHIPLVPRQPRGPQLTQAPHATQKTGAVCL